MDITMEECKHKKKIAEREFYPGKILFSGTRLICLTCGWNTFIRDKSYGKPNLIK